MEYYKELTILPSTEFPQHFILEKIFMELHKAFVKVKSLDNLIFALSFPAYQKGSLGDKIRIFAENEEAFDILGKYLLLDRFSDCVNIVAPIRKVGRVSGYARYVRVQFDHSIHQKARRYSIRHEGVSYDEALQLMKRKKDTTKLPFVKLRSASSGQQFSLFIEKIDMDSYVEGSFNSYGLSLSGCVPEF